CCLMNSQEGGTSVVPFPVSSEEFFFEKDLRKKIRSRLAVESGQPILLYTGRLSHQKNILSLLRVFSVFQQRVNSGARLWLAGPIDDLGVPYLGYKPWYGNYLDRVLRFMSEFLSPETRSQITYWGDLKPDRLKELYHGSDIFVSLSTHNDEDFGMAPAEAMLCGLPLLLSDWGGYAAFRDFSPESCFLTPVRMMNQKISADPQSAVTLLSKALERDWCDEKRSELASRASLSFSCESVAGRLSQSIIKNGKSTFSDFNEEFERICQAFRLNPSAPFLEGKGFSKLYQRLYANYV
ncbi:MAG: glycosyltransferase family 4 protein, partial [Bdellovibrionota bacterium]